MPRLEQGAILAGYKILQRIEASGATETYQAERMQDKALIKLHTFASDSFQSGPAADYYLVAMKQWMQVRQPNIIKVLEAGRSRTGIFFAASAPVNGLTLEDRLWQGGAVEVQAAIGLIISISRVLEWLWNEHGLVYGQLTPRNIILTPDRNILLSHMALAPILKTRPCGISLKDFVASTPGFTCPEQFSAPDLLSFRGDMYSLGATLYHILTGKPPFDCLNAEEVLAQHQHPSLADPRLLRPDLPEEIVWLLEILLAHDPKDRFDDWDYLIKILTSLDFDKPASLQKTLKSHSVMIRLPQADIAKLTRHTKIQPLQTLYPPLPPKKNRKYSAIFLGLSVVIAVMLIIILALIVSGKATKSTKRAQSSPRSSAMGSSDKGSSHGASGFMILLVETRKFARQNPNSYEDILERYENLLTMAETHSPQWVPELQRQVRDINLAMAAPLEEAEQAISLRVKQFEDLGQYQEGIEWLEHYNGTFPKTTGRLRRSLSNVLLSQPAQ